MVAADLTALVLTNEYPPSVYGGAGIHVAELTRALRGRIGLDIRTFGDHAESHAGFRVRGYGGVTASAGSDERMRPAFTALARSLAMVGDPVTADVVHCHTWYTHLGGLLARAAYSLPLAITVHSLEPLRPWKREQLGGGYDLSTWVERTALESADAVIAVSQGTRNDVLRLFDVEESRVHVIHNGIDADFWTVDPATEVLDRYGVDPLVPYLLFVGRITRQKGIVHLVRALRDVDPEIGAVLCAGQPDTPEIAREMEEAVAEARAHRSNLVWIPEMLSRSDVRQLYGHAALFVCPSVYEPFGIINLEAMACERPVVASAVGGIPEVVVDGSTGILVPVELRTDDPMRPVDPAAFEASLASAINRLMADAPLRERMGRAGRSRAVEHFTWSSIADRTVELYLSLAD
jgi:starch synthase